MWGSLILNIFEASINAFARLWPLCPKTKKKYEYIHRGQKLIYLNIFTKLFYKDFSPIVRRIIGVYFVCQWNTSQTFRSCQQILLLLLGVLLSIGLATCNTCFNFELDLPCFSPGGTRIHDLWLKGQTVSNPGQQNNQDHWDAWILIITWSLRKK